MEPEEEEAGIVDLIQNVKQLRKLSRLEIAGEAVKANDQQNWVMLSLLIEMVTLRGELRYYRREEQKAKERSAAKPSAKPLKPKVLHRPPVRSLVVEFKRKMAAR